MTYLDCQSSRCGKEGRMLCYSLCMRACVRTLDGNGWSVDFARGIF